VNDNPEEFTCLSPPFSTSPLEANIKLAVSWNRYATHPNDLYREVVRQYLLAIAQ